MDIEPCNYFDPFPGVDNCNKYCISSPEVWDVEQEWNISIDGRVSTHDSSCRMREELSTCEPDERGYGPLLLGRVDYNNPWQYGHEEILALVPEPLQPLGTALSPILKSDIDFDLELSMTQPFFNCRSESKQGSKGIDTSPSKKKLARRKKALLKPTRGSKCHKPLENNCSTGIRGSRGSRKSEEVPTLDALLGHRGSPRDVLFRLQDSLLKRTREELTKCVRTNLGFQ